MTRILAAGQALHRVAVSDPDAATGPRVVQSWLDAQHDHPRACNRPLAAGAPRVVRSTTWPRQSPELMATRSSRPRGPPTAARYPGRARIKIAGVAQEFVGESIVTAARHEFESEIGGYSTYSEVSGRPTAPAGAGLARQRPPATGNDHRQRDRRRDERRRPRLDGPAWTSAFRGWRRSRERLGPRRGSRMGKDWGKILSLPKSATKCGSASSSATRAWPYVIGGLLNGKSKRRLSSGEIVRALRRRLSSAASSRGSATGCRSKTIRHWPSRNPRRGTITLATPKVS